MIRFKTNFYRVKLNSSKHWILSIQTQLFDTQKFVKLKEFEIKLKKHLDLENLLYVGNGTVALQLALKALKDKHKAALKVDVIDLDTGELIQAPIYKGGKEIISIKLNKEL